MKVLLGTSNRELADLIQRSLSRFHYDWIRVDNGFDAFEKVISQKVDLLILEYELPRMNVVEVLQRVNSLTHIEYPPTVVLTRSDKERCDIEKSHFPKTEIVAWPLAMRQFVSRVQQMAQKEIRVVCVGGGTGLFTLLSGLKTIPNIRLFSIVGMSDDGGSTGKLRHIFGILPPGDIRRSLVALSSAPDLLNQLIQYRFERGGEFKGHSLGNLLLTALSEMRGSMSHAVKSLGEILNIQGEVIPVTEKPNVLKAQLEDGAVIEGEHRIDLFDGHDSTLRIQRLWQEPTVGANPDALEALINAQYIILGPGDLFTSVIANLIVEGIAETIASSTAKKIYICNVMTKPGETTNFEAHDHVEEVVRYLEKDVLDYVICSSTQYSLSYLAMYAHKHQSPVTEKSVVSLNNVSRAKFLWADVGSEVELVRHDSLKLAAELKKIFFSKS